MLEIARLLTTVGARFGNGGPMLCRLAGIARFG
jgi:hypothetical protein